MQDIDPNTLSNDTLAAMKDAALEAVECIRVLTKSGGNLVGEALNGGEGFVEWDHYPTDDVFDPESRAQFYFHAHPPTGRDRPDYGHFHTFVRKQGLPKGVKPAKLSKREKKGDCDDLCHLVAVSMTREGMPERLFTTNRWVTAETWYTAPDAIRALDCFEIDYAYPSWPLNRWITAMLALFRPQIEQLLVQRDERIDAWRKDNPETNVFEDRGLDVTSEIEISLFDQIEWLDNVLESRSMDA